VQTGVAGERSSMRISLKVSNWKKTLLMKGCEAYREQQQLAGAEEARRQHTKLLGEQVTLRG
jgi:hypothetical protein